MVFSPDQIRTAISQQLAAAPILPPGKTVAFFAVVDDTGQKLVAAVKVGDHAQLAGAISHPETGGLTYGVTFAFSM